MDKKGGIIVSKKNLVLQMVRRTFAGNYTCTATNALGTTVSNVVPLSIRCECLGRWRGKVIRVGVNGKRLESVCVPFIPLLKYLCVWREVLESVWMLLCYSSSACVCACVCECVGLWIDSCGWGGIRERVEASV